MLLGSPSWVRAEGNSVGTAVLLVLLHTHSGALLLHLIYCEGPTPSSAWCCHLQAEQSVSFFRHLVTTEPANQSGRPMVAAQSSSSRTGSFWGVFAVSCGKVILSQKEKYTVRGRDSTVIYCISNPFTEKIIVLRDNGRPCKITVASGSWR